MKHFFLLVTVLTMMGCSVSKIPSDKPLNVLFIAVDDLRPELRCYGSPGIISPNIDRLASNGLIFNRAYCQQAVCSPSRTSLLTGLRPDSTKVTDLKTHFRNTIPGVVTLPQYFKQHGYETEWWGKIYHGNLLDTASWTVQGDDLQNKKNWRSYYLKSNYEAGEKNNGNGAVLEKIDVPDNTYPDGKIADQAVASLKKYARVQKPFFLALGFYKPHLPFTAPKKYWDLYDTASVTIPSKKLPLNSPEFAASGWGELRAYQNMPSKGFVSDATAKELIQGYRACVSYTDAQIGKVMDQLKGSGLDKNTIVVLWGDHGWKLGDFGQWSKHTNYEIDVRAPLIISAPSAKTKGRSTNAIVEFIDIYPTLCELAGLRNPASGQGESFAKLFDDPSQTFKTAAFSQFPRGELMGYTMHTEKYRYTIWQKIKSPQNITAVELYDLEKTRAHQKTWRKKKNTKILFFKWKR